MLTPAPAAAASTTATTGFGMRRMANITVWRRWMWWSISARASTPGSVRRVNDFTSPPAMKCPLAPRSTTARTVGSVSTAWR